MAAAEAAERALAGAAAAQHSRLRWRPTGLVLHRRRRCPPRRMHLVAAVEGSPPAGAEAHQPRRGLSKC